MARSSRRASRRSRRPAATVSGHTAQRTPRGIGLPAGASVRELLAGAYESVDDVVLALQAVVRQWVREGGPISAAFLVIGETAPVSASCSSCTRQPALQVVLVAPIDFDEPESVAAARRLAADLRAVAVIHVSRALVESDTGRADSVVFAVEDICAGLSVLSAPVRSASGRDIALGEFTASWPADIEMPLAQWPASGPFARAVQ